MTKKCIDCSVELDSGQQKNVDEILNGVWPTKCFVCGKELTD